MKHFLSIPILFNLWSTSVRAQGPVPALPKVTSSEVINVKVTCAKDLTTYCSKIPPGRGRLYYCLRSHDADLSEECKSALNDKSAKAAL